MPTNSVSNLFSILIVSKCNIYTNTFLNSKNGLTKIQSAGNQRYVSNQSDLSNLVGTSETTRVTTKDNNNNNSFNQWLAGIIDGNGCFMISKKDHCSLEIIVNHHNIKMLRYIQNQFGGSIKLRAGANAYRYRIQNKDTLIQIVHRVNGYIQHSKRIHQLHAICHKLNIQPVMPTSLDSHSSWFAGFFDAKGSIYLTSSDNPKLIIQVKDKEYKNIHEYLKTFGGQIHFDKSQNGFYQWSIQSFTDHITFYNYSKNHVLRSSNAKRFSLIKKYYHLIQFQAYKPNNIHHKAWIYFMNKWNSISELSILYFTYY